MKFLSAVLCLTASLVATLPLKRVPLKGAAPEVPGNEACASCHSEIYKSYLATAMAHASGPALEGFVPGEFEDQVSGVRFRVYERDGRAWMSYERGNELKGEREFLYFIGTGKKGRTYLFLDDGYLFEAPINWYSQENRWNMTPGYTEAREVPMNLPAFSSCLNCHTSGMQPRIPGPKNKFAGNPFLHDGITCERCHGSGEAHLDGKGAIVNPAKLRPSAATQFAWNAISKERPPWSSRERKFISFNPETCFRTMYIISSPPITSHRKVKRLVSSKLCRSVPANARVGIGCGVEPATTRIASRSRKKRSRITEANVWNVMVRGLQRNIMPIGRTALAATCQSFPAKMWLIPNPPITVF